MTAEQAAEQQAADVLAERDAIQANLLELDGSYTRRLLDGGPLTGQTRERWDKASATLASLWETYMAYSAVVDRVAELGAGGRPVQEGSSGADRTAHGHLGPADPRPRPAGAPGPVRHRQAGVHARRPRSPRCAGPSGGSRGDLGRRDGLDRGGRPAVRGGGGTGTRPAAGRRPRRRDRRRVPRCGVQPGLATRRGEQRSARAMARRPSRHLRRGRAENAGGGPRHADSRARPAACAGAAPDRRAQDRDRRGAGDPRGRRRGVAPRRRADYRHTAAAAGDRRAADGQPDQARGRGPVDPAAGRAWTGATAIWPRPLPRQRIRDEPRRLPSAAGTNCAVSSARTRPRPLAWGWPRTPT